MQSETVQEPLRVPLGKGITRRALIDPADAAIVVQHRWHLTSSGYAATNPPRRGSGPLTMHRMLMGMRPGDGLEVDHINLDRLDNRRANLRVVTRPQNDQNRPTGRGSSQYRNVSYQLEKGTWRVVIRVNGKLRHLGSYDDELEAARVAEAGRRAHMPFAVPRPELEPEGPCPCPVCRPERLPQPCNVDGCERMAGKRRGMCGGHYDRVRLYGEPLADVPFNSLNRWNTPLRRAA